MARDPNPFKFEDGVAPSGDEETPPRQPIKEELTPPELSALRAMLSPSQLNAATGTTEVGANDLLTALEQCFGMVDAAEQFDVDAETILGKILAMGRKDKAILLASI